MKNEVREYNIEKLTIETCRLIRQGYEAESNSYLVLLMRRLLEKSENLSQQKLSKLTPIFKIMLDAQYRKDMVYVADILQYEIISLIGND